MKKEESMVEHEEKKEETKKEKRTRLDRVTDFTLRKRTRWAQKMRMRCRTFQPR